MSLFNAAILCVLALSVAWLPVESKGVDQQELLSCEHVSHFFSSINVTIKPDNKNQGTFGGGSGVFTLKGRNI